jgi:hypothetical protein
MRKVVALILPFLVLTSCAAPIERQNAPSSAATTGAESPAAVATVGPVVAGQTVYVPVYSHIYFRDKSRTINLTATLSIRNTDEQDPIRVVAVRYYDTNGKLVRTYINDPQNLAPMASVDFVVAEDDTSGGAGANFIVEWTASQVVTEPVIEAVMISTASGQGISFVSTGRVIASRTVARP